MEVFINPYTDYGFKKLFGEEKNKHLLISVLKGQIGGKEQITDLTFQNTEHLPDGGPHQRKAVFDIYCTNSNSEHFIVELQKAKQNYFKDRTVFYSTFPIQQQAQTGVWDFRLKAVYCIGILDFVFSDNQGFKDVIHTVQFPDNMRPALPGYRSSVNIKDHRDRVFYHKLKFIYVEMPHFNKTLDQLENHCDRWLYFIKNLNTLEEIPELFKDDIIYKGFEVARIAALNKEERAIYEHSLKEYRDLYSVIKTAKQESLEEGKAEGIAIGKAEGIELIALNMIAANMTDQQISLLTPLNIDAVAALRNR